MSEPFNPTTSESRVTGIQEFYTDSVRIFTSVYGLCLELGLSEPVENEEPQFTYPLARVRMSPQHAKVLASLLQRHVDAYEEEVGPIVIPEVVNRESNE